MTRRRRIRVPVPSKRVSWSTARRAAITRDRPGEMPLSPRLDDQPEVRVHLPRPNEDQIAEDEYFRASDDERADAELFRSLLYVGKAQSILTFDEIVERFGLTFEGSILELG